MILAEKEIIKIEYNKNGVTQFTELTSKSIQKYEKIGRLYKYKLTDAIRLLWDGANMLVVQVDGSIKTSGICGNNNDILNDDQTTKQERVQNRHSI